jgi:hypothetical protein
LPRLGNDRKGSLAMLRALFLVATLTTDGTALAQSVFHGNLHSHTSYSDGSGTPDDAFAMARANGMDFFAITEHNHRAGDGKGPRKDDILIGRQPQLYAGLPQSLVESANRNNQPGSFVTIFGQEVSTISKGNHINIFDVAAVVDDTAVPNGNMPALLSWVNAHLASSGSPAVLQFNHPRDPDRNLSDYGRDDYADVDWVKTLDPFVELIEVLNAPALKDGTGFRAEAKEGYYLDYLNLGFHVGPSVGHDNHWRNWGISTDARIGVIANALTRPDILSALKARHTFASDDRNIEVIFRSGESLGGDVVQAPQPGTSLPLSVEIRDPDEPNARYRLDVLSDLPGGDRARRPAESYRIEGNTTGRLPLDGVLFQAPGQFVLLRIIQTSPPSSEGDDEHEETEDRTWTAPIWFEAGAPLPAMAATLAIVDLTPNPLGDDALGEEVRIRNLSQSVMSLEQWQLRDLAGNVWVLNGAIQPGELKAFLRAAQPMSLNNDGDVVELVMPDGRVVDTVRYGRAAEGARINPEH